MLTPFGPFADPNLPVGVDTSSKGERQGGAFVTGASAPAGAFAGPIADDRKHFADLGSCPRLDADLGQAARYDRLHLNRDFVRLDLEQIVAFLDLVADRLEPGEDLALRNRLTQLRHDDR